jgi:transcriptional regulator with XRE-family HTH domain
VDVSLVIRQRIRELGLEQRDLARAAHVTESYISQLLTQKKLPPAPKRTDMYDKLGKLLKLPSRELARLADLQRREQLKRKLGDPPSPLFKEVRALILSKCNPDKETRLRAIFETQPFGELERFVTQKLLDVVKGVAKQEMKREPWLRQMARLSHHNYEQMRTLAGEFVDTNIFTLSIENGVSFLDPLIASWDIDLGTFAMKIDLNRKLAPGYNKKFEFVERATDKPGEEERGLKEFLRDSSLSGNATGDEIEFLRKLSFKKKRPTALYYYRELQNLRDPLHFRAPADKSPAADSRPARRKSLL